MGAEQALLVWAHLLAASIWVGGSIFIGAVLAPLLKKICDSPAERIRLMVIVGRRFNYLALPSLAVLMATGVYNARAYVSEPALLATEYGWYLTVKVTLVAALVGVFVAHVRMLRGSVEAGIESGEISGIRLQSLRRRIIVLGEAAVALSVAVLFFAAALDSGLYAR